MGSPAPPWLSGPNGIGEKTIFLAFFLRVISLISLTPIDWNKISNVFISLNETFHKHLNKSGKL